MDSLRRLRRLCRVAVLTCGITATVSCGTAKDNSVNVAVAANFTEAAQEIARLFERTHGEKAVLSFGSTGQLFTQITQEAPFEVFLAADQETPMKIIEQGFGRQETLFTYAVGKLVLFSTTFDLSQGEAALRSDKFHKIAIANPATAPYGAAAVEAMKALGLYDALMGKLVQGNNVSQTFQFVESSSAELGFVALSQVVGREQKTVWIVPDNLYSPIRQDAVLLNKGADNDAARTFMTFLKSPEAVKVIEKYGYKAAP
jgi:molybdate transport system substrate-binding protein